MVRDIRVKDYVFPQGVGSATTINLSSQHPINGEILRVNTFANFTGSVILKESGTSLPICNYTVTSGTNLWTPQSFTVTTGSFAVNNILNLTVGSLVSGTDILFGPIIVYYR